MTAGQQHAPSTITISGTVRDFRQAPIFMIKVSAYRETDFLEKAYSDESGRYDLTIPSGELITIWFDTHPTLTNSREWHPSVIANLGAQQSFVLDRRLVKVGETGGTSADVDAFTAYQFAALFVGHDRGSVDDQYPRSAADRLRRLKVPSALQNAHADLARYFDSLIT